MKLNKKILIIIGRYLPGYKDGGPVRSIENLVDYLGDEYDFRILTNDRDRYDYKAYDNIKINGWNRVGNSQVYYLEPHGFKFLLLFKMSKKVKLIYLCGCFDTYSIKTLILRRLNLIRIPVIIASMGLFSEGTFEICRKKKEIFIRLCKLMGLFKNIAWSATSQIEVEDIQLKVSRKQKCYIAQDLPRKISEFDFSYKEKQSGKLRIVFLSRISPEKNLISAIKIIKELIGDISFNIYGPKEDKDYWNLCKEELDKLPDNIKWLYKGFVHSEEVINVFKEEHVFIFPTLGENYGHVIIEALTGGCIPIISDKTPWLDLKLEGVGEIISLDNLNEFSKTIQKYIDMESDELYEIKRRILSYLKFKCNNENLCIMYRNIFGK